MFFTYNVYVMYMVYSYVNVYKHIYISYIATLYFLYFSLGLMALPCPARWDDLATEIHRQVPDTVGEGRDFNQKTSRLYQGSWVKKFKRLYWEEIVTS